MSDKIEASEEEIEKPVKKATKPKKKVKKIAKKSSPKLKKAATSKDDPEVFMDVLGYECDERDDVYLAFINSHFGLIIKRTPATVTSIMNADSFQPFERQKEQTFYAASIVEWGNSKSKFEEFGKLMDMGITVTKISRPQSIRFVL